MSLFARLFKGSTIYAATNFLQRGVTFLLLPLYTRYLSPADYGVLAVVTSVVSFIIAISTLGLSGSVSRFYFEYRDEPEALEIYWGSIITFVALLSATSSLVLLALGDRLLAPVLGQVPFWPLMALGVLTAAFQPMATLFTNIMQTTERAKQFARFSLAQFAFSVTATLVCVVWLRWEVFGALAATLLTAVVFYGVALLLLRDTFRVGIHRPYLVEALHYSLPLVPHVLAMLVASTSAKLMINGLIDPAAAGLYTLGLNLASALTILAASINRAYAPLYMDTRTRDEPEALDELRQIGLLLIVVYSLIACAIAAFTPEILWAFTTAAYAPAAVVTPFLVLSAVLLGCYYLFVLALFHEKHATKTIAIATGFGAALNLSLLWLLLPAAGLVGAGLASLLGQLGTTVMVAVIARRCERVRWNYGRIGAVVATGGAAGLLLQALDPGLLWPVAVGAKLTILAGLVPTLSLAAWGQPLYLLRNGIRLWHRLRGRKA